MDLDFIDRVIKVSFILALAGFMFIATALAKVWGLVEGIAMGLGFLAGALWMILNFWALRALLSAAFIKPPRTKKAILLFLFKFPCLYGGGAIIVLYAGLNIIGILIGVSLPLLVVALKAAGIALMKSREGSEGAAGCTPSSKNATKETRLSCQQERNDLGKKNAFPCNARHVAGNNGH